MGKKVCISIAQKRNHELQVNIRKDVVSLKCYLIPKCNIILYLLDCLKLVNLEISIGKYAEKMKILIPSSWSINLNNYLGKQLSSYFVKMKRVYPMTEQCTCRYMPEVCKLCMCNPGVHEESLTDTDTFKGINC